MQKLLEYWPLLLSLFLFLISLGIFLHWNNTALVVTNYTISSDNIPEEFDGFKILQVSDLHNTEFGKDNRRLLQNIREEAPDIIVITGDIIHNQPMAIAIAFAKQVTQIAPTYYVPGNHESRINTAPLYAELEKAGVTLLLNDSQVILRGAAQITLAGIEDITFYPDEDVKDKLQPLINKNGYTILLSHRPEILSDYAFCGADLVFTGHVHGGQFRLPYLGGLYAPNQGLFPHYDAGIYRMGKTQMVVSRGLGNSSFPFRLFNRPEIVVVTLKNGK